MLKTTVLGVILCFLALTFVFSSSLHVAAARVESGFNVPYGDVLFAPDLGRASYARGATASSLSPGYYETSEYLLGNVSVGVVFLESNGQGDPNTEDWNPTEESFVISNITSALNWWTKRSRYQANFTYDIHYRVPTTYEPIDGPHTDEDGWIHEALTSLGYSGTDYFQQCRDYLNALRITLHTDWSYVIFVVDALNDPDGKFTDNRPDGRGKWGAYAYIGGPFTVIPYHGWPAEDTNSMDRLTAHESGHIFYATDEYNGIPEYSGYLNVSDNENSGCLMDDNTWALSGGTRGQVGWRDSDGDGPNDIVDTFPETALIPYSPDPADSTVLTYAGTVTEVPYPNHNAYGTQRNITINIITSVEYRIDGADWIKTDAVDGAFDEAEESFTFTTPALSVGPHLIEARGTNSVGNIETPYAIDSITISTNALPVYIRGDGSIDPPAAPIQRIGEDLYILTDNITRPFSKGIIIERENMTLDGAGYFLEGSLAGSAGVELIGRNNVTIENMHITSFANNVYLAGSHTIIIKGNDMEGGYYGTYLSDSSNNSINGNNVTGHDVNIFLTDSSNNSINGNNITRANDGISLDHSSDNTIDGNNIIDNLEDGIYQYECPRNILHGNDIEFSYYGIEQHWTSNTVIDTNTIMENGYGICLGASRSINISRNQISLNWRGISATHTTEILILENDISNNEFGLVLVEATAFVYHNNFFNDSIVPSPAQCAFDEGYPSGGNYWSNYTDLDSLRGPGQDVLGSDGVWDHPYVIDADNIDRYPLVNPWVRQEALAVRGTDDRVYYRCRNEVAWQDWMVLPGSTVDSPAIAMLGNQLHFVVRGSDGSSLWHGYLTNPEDPSSFSGWTLLSGATSSAPTLISNGTVLCLVVRGLDDCVYYRCNSKGYSWGEWQSIPTGATCDGPAAAMLGDDLQIVVRGMDGSSLWDTMVSCDGTVVGEWSLILGATPSKPILTCSGSDSQCLVVRGMDNRIYYQNDWGDWNALSTGATIDGPGATVMDNVLCTVVRGTDGSTLWYGDIKLATNDFTGWTLIGGATPSAPTLTANDC